MGTHTYAILEVEPAAFEDIKRRLLAVDYGFTIDTDNGREIIDMHGIALAADAPDARGPLINLKPYQQRVVDEREALEEKLEKLTAFLNSPTVADLPRDEHERLSEQARHMRDYSRVLAQRIAQWK